MLIDLLDLPRRFSQPAIETRLVGSGGELAIDAADRFVFHDGEASHKRRQNGAHRAHLGTCPQIGPADLPRPAEWRPQRA